MQTTLTETLHLSLAREHLRRARHFFNEISAAGWTFNQDQIDYIRDCAHDAQRKCRQHLEAALWSRRRAAGRRFAVVA